MAKLTQGYAWGISSWYMLQEIFDSRVRMMWIKYTLTMQFLVLKKNVCVAKSWTNLQLPWEIVNKKKNKIDQMHM